MIKRRISNSVQEAVVDILEDIIVMCMMTNNETTTVKSMFDKLDSIVEEHMNKYCIKKDPYTFFPCTTKTYVRNNIQHQRDTMIEKYGHHDGI